MKQIRVTLFPLPDTEDPDQFAQRTVIRPVNYRRYQKKLEDCIFHRTGEIALTLYLEMAESEGIYTTARVTRNLLPEEMKDVPEETLLDRALRNTMKKYPAQVCNVMANRIYDFMADSFSLDELLFHDNVLLSNSRTVNGAIALWYPGVAEKFYGLFQGSFYAVFMNVNDVMLRSARNGIPHALLAYAREEDSTMGIPLSGGLYMYDGTQIRMVEA